MAAREMRIFRRNSQGKSGFPGSPRRNQVQGPQKAFPGSYFGHLEVMWGHLGVILGVILGLFLGHFGVVFGLLGSFWGSFLHHFEVLSEVMGSFQGHFGGHFVIILGSL